MDFKDDNLHVNSCTYRKSMRCGITGKNSAVLGKMDSEWSGYILAPEVEFSIVCYGLFLGLRERAVLSLRRELCSLDLELLGK